MVDFDDELLALADNGSSSSRSSSVDAPRRKRRREMESSDMDESDEDAEGSDEEEELVNLYPVDGIYKDEADRERLRQMPELDREDELAARRDEITRRRQKADLAAMVRTQQDAGKKKPAKVAASRKKTRKLKRASAPKKAKKKSRGESDEEGDDYAEADEDDDDQDGEDEEDEEESDYERTTTRRGNRSRKATGATSQKHASLSKLKKKRVKAEKRRKGQDTDEESSDDQSSEYDEEAQEILNRKAKERDRRDRDYHYVKREVKASREEERIAQKRKYEMPTLVEINAARLRRDHLPRMVHRPDWINHLIGKFVRVSMQIPDQRGRMQHVYRLTQIINTTQSDKYYEVVDQCTNVYCTMAYGEEKSEKVPLTVISGSPLEEEEYERWNDRIKRMPESKSQRLVPSREATLDMSEDLEAFISRPFTEQDINNVIVVKRQAREAFQNGQRNKGQQQDANANSKPQVRLGYDEVLMTEMNEKHRKADRERIAEAERRNAALQKKAANGPAIAPAASALDIKSGIENGSAIKADPTITSLSLAAAAIDVDLGDF